MHHLVGPVLQYLKLHPQWSWSIAFIISFVQSFAIVGVIVPGSLMTIGIGSLIAMGLLPLWSTLIGTIVGAVIGASISYWIGYSFKDHLHRVWPFSRCKSLIQRGRSFFLKHGGKSIFLGRLLSAPAAIVPLVAGMMGMKAKFFHVSTFLSGIVWGVMYTLVGILLAEGFLHVPLNLFLSVVFVLLLLSSFWFFLIYRKRLARVRNSEQRTNVAI